MKFKVFIYALLSFNFIISVNGQYIFTDEIKIPCTEVKNQERTGTCWSFSSTSFLESEILRIKNIEVNLSEMYSVRMSYINKAQNYMLRQGKANFSEGGLAHDVLKTIELYGIVTQEAYPGIGQDDESLDHNELFAGLEAYLKAVVKNGHPGKHWMQAFEGILDAYMSPFFSTFKYNKRIYNPLTFKEAMGIDEKNYINITSFNHHPFYKAFILEIPDNYLNGNYFNVKLEELIQIINNALENGYTLIWDGDISERGFSQKNGMAILPVEIPKDSLFIKYIEEIEVNQENRQENFMSYTTTDDHLMHIIGRAKDQNNNVYYIIKNSWGEQGEFKGYLYMSEAYMKMKTIAVTLHKEGLPEKIAEKIKQY